MAAEFLGQKIGIAVAVVAAADLDVDYEQMACLCKASHFVLVALVGS